MLAVCIGQLTAEDFHLIRCAALGAASRTRRLSPCRRPQRSGGCRQSAARHGSARVLARTPGLPTAVDREPQGTLTPGAASSDRNVLVSPGHDTLNSRLYRLDPP